MKILKPIILSPYAWMELEKQILVCLYDLLFSPLEAELSPELENDKVVDFLLEAIKRGKIQYSEDKFIGGFSARISKRLKELGGTFKNKSWYIPKSKLPVEILTAISRANIRYQQILTAILKKLDNINLGEKLKNLTFSASYERVIDDLDNQFYRSLSDVSLDEILTPTAKEEIARNYSENLKLYINNFAESQVLKLREEVQDNIYTGGRAEGLEKVIKDRYEVTKSKARFLARQETSLLTSQYREQRYKEAGINEYRWRTSRNAAVRPDHKILDDQIFRWDTPPVVDRKTGRRAHPGEDYGCKCIALPIIR